MDDLTPNPARTVVIDLLDSSFERTIKSWSFADRERITIGRADDQDVEVSDAYVSRTHAQLVIRNDEWVLVSVGRNGVLVENKPITELVMRGEAKFRLGASGPCLRFRTTGKAESVQTICFDVVRMPVFNLDETKVEQEVEAIAGGDYFQSLQRRARDLRKQRDMN
jgi:pSer/pThr/pTyr-binding forkhead associated (FHA) protein